MANSRLSPEGSFQGRRMTTEDARRQHFAALLAEAVCARCGAKATTVRVHPEGSGVVAGTARCSEHLLEDIAELMHRKK